MQQYFIDEELYIGKKYIFNAEQKHHAYNVVRLDNEIVRLVYNSKAYLAKAYMDNGIFVGEVFEVVNNINELANDIVLAMALIRKEKFELVIQKATELGVTKIIPFISERCIVQNKKDKSDRYKTIALEAAQQCKRNIIPDIMEPIPFKKLIDYKKDKNFIAYEKIHDEANNLLNKYQKGNDCLIVIGPEGGFSEKEVEYLIENKFDEISLGNRILRAETAAIYACSIIGEIMGAKK